MLFIGFAILVAGLLGLLIASDAGSLIGLQQDQFGHLLFLLILLLFFSASMFSRRIRASQVLGGVLMWGAVFLVAVGAYTYRFEIQHVGSRILGELVPGTTQVTDNGQTVRVSRSIGGTFHIDGSVNGSATRFIFDTGASAVVLTREDAARAGINVNALNYTLPVQTANGTGRAAMVRLDEIMIGGIRRSRVTAFVASPGTLDISLLGMSFLETLSSYTVSNDGLELKG